MQIRIFRDLFYELTVRILKLCLDDLQKSRQEAEKAQKQADKYKKRINEPAPMIKNMEKLAADFSADPEQTLPEAAVMNLQSRIGRRKH